MDTDPDGYIEKLNALLENKRSPSLKAVRAINLSAAYSRKREYENAKRAILEANEKKLHKSLAPYYWTDLALYEFYLGENDAALAITGEKRELIDSLRSGPNALTVAILDVLQANALGDKDKAQELILAGREKFPDEKYSSKWQELEEFING
jgi:hypothetical protein